MRFAAVVLRNITTDIRSVDFSAVSDALLSGGVKLEEVCLLPYDEPKLILSALLRLQKSYDSVFLVCDRVLLPMAKEAVSAVSGKGFDGEISYGENCLFAVLPAGAQGKEAAKKIIPVLDEKRGESYYSVVLKVMLAPASKVASVLASAQEEAGEQVEIHASEKFGDGRIEFVYNKNTPKVVLDEAVRTVASALKPYLYATEDVTIQERLFEALKLHRLKFSTAESFTGGGVGRAIVSIPGASKVFFEGLNTYDSLSKQRRLGVSDYTLKQKGAISSETAYEMASGLLKEGADVVVSTTGVAGPGAEGENPAGKCFIAVGTREDVRVFEYRLEGDRETVICTAVNLALFLTYKEIH